VVRPPQHIFPFFFGFLFCFVLFGFVFWIFFKKIKIKCDGGILEKKKAKGVELPQLESLKGLVVVPNLVLAIARTVVRIAFAQVPRSNPQGTVYCLKELTLHLG
jgi:hypothetical protein